jgi:ABC-type multidrug transport system fused ATPase/permease subunit
VRTGLLTIGAFTFYFDTIRRVGEVFQQFVYTSVSITENSYHIDNFRKVLELPDNSIGGSKTITTSKPPKIEFQDVSFKYPGSDSYVFKGLNLIVMPGEEIALVGENGAGKSTLIKLLCCFYYPTSGRILIDGVDTRELSLTNWYKHLAYLTQEFNNFGNMTLSDNVTMGDPKKKVVEENILLALKSADAKFWQKYSNGLATMLSQRYGGEEPSWGQWQKISIARIFYRKSSIMILDEPTASIDAVSEYKIFNELYKKISGKTLIIVSHRFSTVRNAGRILVLNKGKIVEAGSHSELIKHDGIYAKSFALQAEGYN